MASLPIIDVHTHLAGLGHGGTGCFIAPEKFDSLLYKLMRKKLGIYNTHREQRLDQAYLQRLDDDVRSASQNRCLDAVIVFPHEKIYSDSGDPQGKGQELYVPNDYAFACARREEMKGRMLPAMSVHPYRQDACGETVRCIEQGAVVMKWLPNSQNINPRDKRCRPIYQLLARHRIPLIAHTGGEHTVSIVEPAFGDPELLLAAVEEGVTVIAAHCGTKSGIFDRNWMPKFIELAQKHPLFYGDTSAFCTPGRARWIARFVKTEGLSRKLVHGSDYPVPPSAWASVFRLGIRKAYSLERVWSYLERDVKIKTELGFPQEVFTNAALLLPQRLLERWGVSLVRTEQE